MTDTNKEYTQEYIDELSIYRESYDLPKEWTDEQVATIVESGIEPKKTDRGNWVTDPTRTTVDHLTDSELKDAIDNRITEFGKDQRADVLEEIKKRVNQPRWFDQDVLDYFMFGKEQEATASGVLVKDKIRDTYDAGSYSDAELDAWTKGEIEAGSGTTDAELAVEINRRFKLNSKSLGVSDVIEAYQDFKEPKAPIVQPIKQKTEETPKVEGLTKMNLSFIEGTLNQYFERCAPSKPITMEQGTQCQKALDVLFRYVINLADPKGFASAMDHIRLFIAKHRDGLFSDTYAYRFTGGLSDANNQRESHIQLIELFRVYTNPLKEARKQIHLPVMIANFPPERQAIITEYFKSLS